MATTRSSLGGWAQNIRLAINKIELDVNNGCYKIARELFLKIVQNTPSPVQRGAKYAKGALVNNWYPLRGNGFSSDSTEDLSPYGEGSISRIKAVVGGGAEFFKKDGSFTLSNNLDYAYQAEALGWQKTGPYAMVSLSIQEISARYK